MKKTPFYCRQVPLFKAVKYYNKSDDRKETYFIIGYRESEHTDSIYNLRINDKTGYIRPDYNLPVMDMVYVVDTFDIKPIIVSLFTEELDSRWHDVLKHIGEDTRNKNGIT